MTGTADRLERAGPRHGLVLAAALVSNANPLSLSDPGP